MKKLILGLLILLSASMMFGQTDVDSQKLLVGLYDFITEPSSNWKIYDGAIISADPINDEYTITGGFIVKVLLSNSRYNFVCSVKNTGDDISVEISQMESYICDKNGNLASGSSVNETSNRVASQYAKQIKEEILARMADISEDTIETAYAKVVTLPNFIKPLINTMSELALKRFVEQNINGKEVELEIALSSIDENRNPITNELYPLNYKAKGFINGVYESGWGRNMVKKSYSLNIYSNNDKLLSTKIGATYKAKGKVNLKQIGSGLNQFWSYEISEE